VLALAKLVAIVHDEIVSEAMLKSNTLILICNAE
jgi:hypothetical protein